MIREVKKEGITFGELPNKYEAGTMATAQVIAFGESIKFINKIGIENIEKHDSNISYVYLPKNISYDHIWDQGLIEHDTTQLSSLSNLLIAYQNR